MNPRGFAAAQDEVAGHVWHFADCEFDELGRQLRVKGKPVEVESKPLDLLLQLLLHAGEVVTKEELLEEVWPDVMVVDGSLATAISKLRRAIGDEDHPVIVTVPRIGYRLAVPVHCKTVAAPASAWNSVFGPATLFPATTCGSSYALWIPPAPAKCGLRATPRPANSASSNSLPTDSD